MQPDPVTGHEPVSSRLNFSPMAPTIAYPRGRHILWNIQETHYEEDYI